MTSSTAIGWVGVETQRGTTMAGRFLTSWRVSSQEIPPAPTMMPARSAVTGTPVEPSSSSTSRRERRWGDSSPSSAPSPPR